MEELKRLLEEQRKAFEDFKKANDERLALLEKGRADATVEAKVNKANEEIGRLEKQIRDLETKAARPGRAADGEQGEDVKEHRKAFQRYLRKGDVDGLGELQQKALAVGVDADGGFAVPEDLDRSVGQIVRVAAPMEGIVNSITVGNETYEKIFNLGGAASGWVGETAARAATGTPTLASVKPFFGELYANPAATQKMLDDSFFDAEAWLAEEVGLKFGLDLDLAIVNGDGSNKPKGILQYTINSTADASRTFGQIQYVASGSAADFEDPDLIDLVHALKAGYRQAARWVMNTLTVAKVRKFKDATSGQYLWQPGLAQGQPATLLGYPITEDDNLDVAGANKYPVWFGDFKRAYKVANVRGVRSLRDPYTNKPYVQFYSTKRVGGGLEDSNAIKLLKCATS